MLTVTDSYIIIGLDNGTLAGWNLLTNNVDYMQVDVQAISCLQKHLNLIFIGTAQGKVEIRETKGYQLIIPSFETNLKA